MAVIDHDVPPESFTEKRTITAFHARHCEAPMRIREPGEIKRRLIVHFAKCSSGHRSASSSRFKRTSVPPCLVSLRAHDPKFRNFSTLFNIQFDGPLRGSFVRLFIYRCDGISRGYDEKTSCISMRASFTLIADPFTWIVGFAEKSIIVSLLVLALLFLPSFRSALCR